MAVAGSQISKPVARLREGRAVNAVADFLRKMLYVPNIYLEPPSSIIAADVLAVDRGGSGDLHAVEIKLGADFSAKTSSKPANTRELNQLQNAWLLNLRKKVKQIHSQLMSLPAHYRYLSMPSETQGSSIERISSPGPFLSRRHRQTWAYWNYEQGR
jgi:hypothetical protein